MARPVPFGAPKEVDKAQQKVCSTAAMIANRRVRKEFLAQDNDLTRKLRQSKKKSLDVMRQQWSPLKADWHYGMALKIRDSDIQWLMKSEYTDWLQEIVTDAMTEAILIHKKDWTTALLNDALVSDIPYYQISDKPSRLKRLSNWIRRRSG